MSSTPALPGALVKMSSREVIRALEAAGWIEVRSKGSHRHFKHPKRPGTVTVPHPEKDLPLGTVKSIEKHSGVQLRDGH